VMWHGMGDTCCNPQSMGFIKSIIEQYLPGVYVFSVEIGNSEEDDQWNGFFKNINEQVSLVCSQLASNPNLTNGFNAVGFSQGGQFLRAYVERCNDPPVYNLITMGGQHQGVADIPSCFPANTTVCQTVQNLLDLGAYSSLAQDLVVQAQYFHDPLDAASSEKFNHFLPDVNNDNTVNTTYKKNLLSLKNLVLVMFSEDTVVVPKESEWFGFYEDGSNDKILAYNETKLYQTDQIGLKTLDQTGRLKFDTAPGEHMQFSLEWFGAHVIEPYLRN